MKRDKRLESAMYMPERKRMNEDVEVYSPKHDEVLKWIAETPELLQYMFDLLHRIGYIVYDPYTKTWKGKMTKGR